MNAIVIIVLTACGFLRAMEQKSSPKITPIAEQVLGFASKTGKIITTKDCPDAVLGDIAVSPSGDFLAIMKGEWLNVARMGKAGSTAIGEPVRIKKFAGSLLFLDKTRFLVFRKDSFCEYWVSDDGFGIYSFKRLTKTAYGANEVSFCKVEPCEPVVFSPSVCVVPLYTGDSHEIVLRKFVKESKNWSVAPNLFTIEKNDQLIGSAAIGAFVLGDPQSGDINWFCDEKGILKDANSLCKKMSALFISPGAKMLFVGYDGDRKSELYDMTTKSPSCVSEIALSGAAIHKVFWNNASSQCLVVMRGEKASAFLVSGMPAVSDTLRND